MLSRSCMIVIVLGCISVAQTLEWHKEYNGTGSNIELVYDVIMDQSRNVYVTGVTSDITNVADLTTIKYNSSGNQLWVTTIDFDIEEYGEEIYLDDDDDVYVVGSTKEGSTRRLLVIKYDGSTGDTIWTNHTLVLDAIYWDLNIVTDCSSDVYVATGHDFGGLYGEDFCLIKFDGSNGDTLWRRSLNYMNGEVWKGIIANKDTIYVAGTQILPSSEALYVAKYKPNGDTCWVREYSPNAQAGADAIDIDTWNNIYVGGTSDSAQASHPLVVKYNNAGTLQWAYHYMPFDSNTCHIYDIGVYYQTGDSYVTGNISNNDVDVLTIAVDKDGRKIWDKEFDRNLDNTDIGEEIALTNSCVYVSGRSDSVDKDILTICYLRSTGSQKWAKTYDYGGDDVSWTVASKKSGSTAYTVSAGQGCHALTGTQMATLMYSYLEPGWNPNSPGPQSLSEGEYCTIKNLYPNPTKGELGIQLKSRRYGKVEIRLYDVNGRLIANIYKGNVVIGKNEFRYTLKEANNGILFVCVMMEDYYCMEKVIFCNQME